MGSLIATKPSYWNRARFYTIHGRQLPSVTTILDVNPTTHEMTFCFTTKSGTQYTVTWRDNGEPGNTGAGTTPANADKLTLRTGCSLVGPILWGVVVDPLLHGNVQWHDQGR